MLRCLQSILPLFALSAGICEELTTRGYLQQQFEALFGSNIAGVLAQAAVFGAGHLYQGWKMALNMMLNIFS